MQKFHPWVDNDCVITLTSVDTDLCLACWFHKTEIMLRQHMDKYCHVLSIIIAWTKYYEPRLYGNW